MTRWLRRLASPSIELGFVDVKERAADFRAATYHQYADRVSDVVRHARVETAADRARTRRQQPAHEKIIGRIPA